MNRRYFLSALGAVGAVAALSKFTGLAEVLLPANPNAEPRAVATGCHTQR